MVLVKIPLTQLNYKNNVKGLIFYSCRFVGFLQLCFCALASLSCKTLSDIVQWDLGYQVIRSYSG